MYVIMQTINELFSESMLCVTSSFPLRSIR